MNINNLKNTIFEILKTDDRVWNKEKNELNQTLLIDLLDKIDEKIIGILLENEEARNKFFVKIKDVFVFKTNDFKFFLEENKVNNSFTKYKNQIGLTDGRKFLKDSGDVVLDFPFKDCVLEGGQSSEEGLDTYFEYEKQKQKTVDGEKIIDPAGYKEKTTKRKEIFFNQILAKDEIDCLFDEKALVGWKRFNKEGESEVREIKRDANGTIKENLIIEGNNLLALHSLKSQFAGKVKLIYIDPPYNTDGNANTFAYNNSFNHSTWLTFMRNRLEVARGLLSNDGSIVIAIDHAELFYVGVLADEIFERSNRVGLVAVETNPRGRADSKFFATSHEYFLVYAKSREVFNLNDFELNQEQKNSFKLKDEISQYRLLPLQRSGSNSTPDKRPKLRYPIYFDPANKVISLDKFSDNLIEIYPNDGSGTHKVWRISKDSSREALSKNDIVIRDTNGKYTVLMKDRIKDGRKAKTFWSNPQYDASSHGTMLLKQYFDSNVFSYPKSIHLIKDILKICANKNDLILDFFGGSGTTAHAVLELNKEDGGNRKFILCEQMDYINTVTCPRVMKFLEKENINDSFIHLELAKHNETAKEKILNCQNLKELEDLFDELYEKYFLNYNLKIKEFKEKVLNEDEFKILKLEEQKRMFLTMLDLNQMYVNKSEMADKNFAISQQDQELTKEFYKSEV